MKPLTPEERLSLAHEVYHAYYEGTESFRVFDIGSHIAYLMGAILGNEQPGYTFMFDRSESEIAFFDLTRNLFDPHHPVWQFIEVMDANGELEPHPEQTLKMIVAGTDANGGPNLLFFHLKTTDSDVEAGKHYERAMDVAREQDYEGPFVVWDEDDAPRALLDLFEWKSASTY